MASIKAKLGAGVGDLETPNDGLVFKVSLFHSKIEVEVYLSIFLSSVILRNKTFIRFTNMM